MHLSNRIGLVKHGQASTEWRKMSPLQLDGRSMQERPLKHIDWEYLGMMDKHHLRATLRAVTCSPLLNARMQILEWYVVHVRAFLPALVGRCWEILCQHRVDVLSKKWPGQCKYYCMFQALVSWIILSHEDEEIRTLINLLISMCTCRDKALRSSLVFY